MNLTALTARCKKRFADPNNNVLADGDWTDYLNDAYADALAASPYWPFFETQVTNLAYAIGVRSAALPTDAFRVSAVWNATDQFRLTPIEGRNEVYLLFPDQNETGQPTQYRVFSNTLQVYPLPEKATTLQVEYFAGPAATLLVAGGDVPVFPSQYHRLLVEGALSRAYTDDGNSDWAKMHGDREATLIQQMVNDLLGTRQSRNAEIVDDWYGR